jgi:hypothetical protein
LLEQSQHFAEYLDEEEANWRRTQFFIEFDYFVGMYFAPGRNKAQLAQESKVDPAIITRILPQKDGGKRMVPSAPNLMRICAVLYNHRIIPNEAEGDRLFSLLRYATPTEVRKARMQTTEHRAVVKPVKTDELPPAPSLPEWAKRG